MTLSAINIINSLFFIEPNTQAGFSPARRGRGGIVCGGMRSGAALSARLLLSVLDFLYAAPSSADVRVSEILVERVLYGSYLVFDIDRLVDPRPYC